MSILVMGINHKTAPITLREKVYFALDKLPLYLQDLLSTGNVKEAVLLSTCNRSELYCDCDTSDIDDIKTWFSAQTSIPSVELYTAMYIYRNKEAVAHIMEVACGLDSMVLGEPQILGQMKEAFAESCSAGAVGFLFHQLFQHIFTVAKEIRSTTAIGACPVSLASAAFHFARQQIPNFENARVLLLGAGDTIELLIRYLKNNVREPIILVNRNLKKAEGLLKEMRGEVYEFTDLTKALKQADIIFSATGSPTPILDQAVIREVMQSRNERSLTLMDMAVPRDIKPEVAHLPNVNLYCIDDLKVIIEKNRQGREHAADKAKEMIDQKSMKFMIDLNSFDKVSHTIRAYRSQIEEMCQVELLKARHQLNMGTDPGQVLDTFAKGFTKKLLHAPSVQIRQAGVEGRFEFLRFAKQLFAIPDTEIEQL